MSDNKLVVEGSNSNIPCRKLSLNEKKLKEAAKAYLALAPVMALIIIFYILPIIINIMFSFTNYSVRNFKDYKFVGFDNYKYVFGQNLNGLTSLTLWTFIFAISVVLISFFVGTILAIILNDNGIKLRKFYRTIFIIPWVIPSVITLLMWRGLLNTNYGFINKVLEAIGFNKIPWLSDPIMARISIILIVVWFSFPFLSVIALGLLQSIPRDLYESAQIDGSTGYKSFTNITLPCLLRGMTPVLILAFIMQFNQFGVYIVTKGEPASKVIGDPGATDLLLTYVYNTAFRVFRYDLAATYSVVIFVFMAIFALVNMKFSEKISKE
ncbi:MAG: sugar ABC transporter permease [Clostridiaceae bacterium]|nr:sugar ABC transporter permease [Clostridiaceae bacterium]